VLTRHAVYRAQDDPENYFVTHVLLALFGWTGYSAWPFSRLPLAPNPASPTIKRFVKANVTPRSKKKKSKAALANYKTTRWVRATQIYYIPSVKHVLNVVSCLVQMWLLQVRAPNSETQRLRDLSLRPLLLSSPPRCSDAHASWPHADVLGGRPDEVDHGD
jgi:hypothetical protein